MRSRASVPVALVVADRPCEALDRARRPGSSRCSWPATASARTSTGSPTPHAMVAELREPPHRPHRDGRLRHDLRASRSTTPIGGRILNTHPALLPAFPGWHAVRDALAYGVKVTGCTVHVAGLEVDTGPILAQEAVPRPRRRHRVERCTSASRRWSASCTPTPSARSWNEVLCCEPCPALRVRQGRGRRAGRGLADLGCGARVERAAPRRR